MRTIYTLDARDNVMWEVIKDEFNLSAIQMNREIGEAFDVLVASLSNKNIDYKDLQFALIPSLKKKEIALVFDTLTMKEENHGYSIFKKFLPLLDKTSTHSILVGDFVDPYKQQERIFRSFETELIGARAVEYQHSSQFYLIYLNNVSDAEATGLFSGLQKYDLFVGMFDITFSSFLRSYLSMILVNSFIKYRDIVIQGHSDDMDNEADENSNGYPFKEHGFKIRSLQGMYFSPFLGYKIERPMHKEAENDFEISLSSISGHEVNLKDLALLVEENKIQYLFENKTGSMKKSGLWKKSKTEIEAKIRDKLSSNYIFNLVYREGKNKEGKDYILRSFNIIIEFQEGHDFPRVKILCAFEVLPAEKKLRLITLY